MEQNLPESCCLIIKTIYYLNYNTRQPQTKLNKSFTNLFAMNSHTRIQLHTAIKAKVLSKELRTISIFIGCFCTHLCSPHATPTIWVMHTLCLKRRSNDKRCHCTFIHMSIYAMLSLCYGALRQLFYDFKHLLLLAKQL